MKNVFATVIGTSVLTAGIVSMSAIGASAATLVGIYSGNDTGNNGTAIANLNAAWPDAGWMLAGKSDEGFGTFTQGGHGELAGTLSTGLTGPGAFSIKAGTGYTLWTIDNIATINWSTLGLWNGGGNQPGLSHLSVYTGKSHDVPEPLTMMGSAVALGFGGMFQKKRNAKKSAK